MSRLTFNGNDEKVVQSLRPYSDISEANDASNVLLVPRCLRFTNPIEFCPAHPALMGIVSGYYLLRNLSLPKNRTLMGMCCGFVIVHIFLDDVDMKITFGEKTVESVFQGTIAGQIKEPAEISFRSSLPALISIELFPVAFEQLFGISVLDINGTFPCLGDVLGSEGMALIDRLRLGSSWREQTATLDAFFLKKCIDIEKTRFYHQCVGPLYRSAGNFSVGEMQKGSGLSSRQFERRFKRQTGVSALVLRRFVRSNVALARLLKNDAIIDIICDLKYVDQSHLTKDIKWYTGKTPKAISSAYRNKYFRLGSATFIWE